jgi:hypothetical protein
MHESKRQAYYEMLHKLYGLTATQDDLLEWVKKQNLRVYSDARTLDRSRLR